MSSAAELVTLCGLFGKPREHIPEAGNWHNTKTTTCCQAKSLISMFHSFPGPHRSQHVSWTIIGQASPRSRLAVKIIDRRLCCWGMIATIHSPFAEPGTLLICLSLLHTMTLGCWRLRYTLLLYVESASNKRSGCAHTSYYCRIQNHANVIETCVVPGLALLPRAGPPAPVFRLPSPVQSETRLPLFTLLPCQDLTTNCAVSGSLLPRLTRSRVLGYCTFAKRSRRHPLLHPSFNIARFYEE